MTRDIVVETTKATDAWPKGTELGYASEAKATSVLGEGAFRVVRYQDGTAIEPRPQKAAPRKRKAPVKKVVPAQPVTAVSTPIATADVVEN
ncbi:MAG: hypothetical protein M3457_02880 [Chloroflexota bacterium]|nr:hypothetical protein [Chloroflexota bacterium]